MMSETRYRGGFSWPELVIALAVMMFLLLVGFVAFKRVTYSADLETAVASARRINSACRAFAEVRGGGWLPDVAHRPDHAAYLKDANGVLRVPTDTSTDNFQVIISSDIWASEREFHVSREHQALGRLTTPVDGDLTTPLQSGQVGWNYVRGLHAKNSPQRSPVVFTRHLSSGPGLKWPTNNPQGVGGIWKGKIVVGRLDYSAAIFDLDKSGRVLDEEGRDMTMPLADSPYTYDHRVRILAP